MEKVPFPSRELLQWGVLAVLSSKGPSKIQAVYEAVRELFKDHGVVLAEKDPEGRSKLEHELRWARQTLVSQGLMTADERGVWGLTAEGLAAANKPIVEVGSVDDRTKADRLVVKKYESTGRTLDDLPYTPDFESLFEEMRRSGLVSDRQSLFKWLHSLRKEGKLPRLGRAGEPLPQITHRDWNELHQLVTAAVGHLENRDSLVYSARFDALAEEFVRRTGRTMSQHDVWRLVAVLSASIPAMPAASLSLYFDLSEFSPAEIAAVLQQFSSLYESVGGDQLVIEDVSMLDPASVLQPTGGEW
jgi:hypothetical protein